MNRTAEDMIKLVRHVFDPLSEKLGLRGPTAKTQNISFSLGYFGNKVGFEIQVDLLPFLVMLLPFRMTGEDKVPIGYTDGDGLQQKRYLQEVLARLRIPYDREDKYLREMSGKWDNCEAMANILAKLLEQHWPAICDHADDLFSGSD
jgi:hypothetical protein